MHYTFLNIYEHNNSSYTGTFTTSSGEKWNKYIVLKNFTWKIKSYKHMNLLWILLQLAFSYKSCNPGKLIRNYAYSPL